MRIILRSLIRRSLIFPVLFLLFIVSALSAQGLRFDVDGTGDPVEISQMTVSVNVRAAFAEVTMDLTLFNNSDAVRGGNLLVPLPDEALLMGYSLEVDGVLIDGVPVERTEARQVYESIVRQGIDPGLIEYAQGNIFRTRVFPLEPHKSRRLTITYTSMLEGPDARVLRLPLTFEQTVEHFTIKVLVLDVSRAPEALVQGMGSLDFTSWDTGFYTESTAYHLALEGELVMLLPESGLHKPLVETYGTQTWFSVLADLGRDARIRDVLTKPAPQIRLYVDASFSQRNRDNAIIADMLQNIAKRLQKDLFIEVLPFRDTLDESISVRVSAQSAQQLRHVLDALVYDGGIRFDTLTDFRSDALNLIVTDGIPSLGSGLPTEQAEDLLVLLSEGRNDRAFASRLAGSESVFGMGTMSAALLAEAVMHTHSEYTLSVASGKLADLQFYHPFGDPQRLMIAGTLHSASAELMLHSNGTPHTVRLDARNSRSGSVARFNWAQAQLRAYMQESDYASPSWYAKVRQFGLNYNIVTPGSSLLVLESLQQYLEFRIPPPENKPEWRTAYFAAVSEQKAKEQVKKEDLIDVLHLQWKERLMWWNAEFPEKPVTMQDSSISSDERRDRPATAAPFMEMEDSAMPMHRQAREPQEEADSSVSSESFAEINLEAWNPERPYLAELRAVHKDLLYKTYLRLRNDYEYSPAFYLEVGDYFHKQDLKAFAVRIWSNLAELGTRDPALLRVLGHRLAQAYEYELAILIFQTVKEERPDEPQSHRDLALLAAKVGDFVTAVEKLYFVATSAWQRTAGIELVSLMELNRYFPAALEQGLDSSAFDKRLIHLLDLDVRIVLSWDADLTDMDLWIIEPSGFKVYYADPRSPNGGHLSRDIVDGYGPEEYMIRKALKGEYLIQVNYYGSASPELTGSVTLFVDVFTNYGRDNETVHSLTLQLDEAKDVYTVGTIHF